MGKDHLLLSRPSSPSCPSGLSIASGFPPFVVSVTATTLFAQTHGDHAMPPLPRDVIERPLPLRRGIGVAHDAVSTRDPQAQAYYDQGLAYLQLIRVDRSRTLVPSGAEVRSRPGDRRRRPQLRLCRAERAGGSPSGDRSRAWARGGRERARSPSHRAARRSDGAPKTRLATSSGSPRTVRRSTPRWRRGRLTWSCWLLRGLAESTDPSERGQGSPSGSVRFFERAVTLAPTHFAAHHYLTHAFENAGRTSRRARAGRRVRADGAPGAARGHMLGHELRRAGRSPTRSTSSKRRIVSRARYLANEHVPAAHVWHYHHNLDLLATSSQYVGRVVKAEALFKQSFAIPSNCVEQEFNKREWPVFLRARGRANDALAAAGDMRGAPVAARERDRPRAGGRGRLALQAAASAAKDATRRSAVDAEVA